MDHIPNVLELESAESLSSVSDSMEVYGRWACFDGSNAEL